MKFYLNFLSFNSVRHAILHNHNCMKHLYNENWAQQCIGETFDLESYRSWESIIKSIHVNMLWRKWRDSVSLSLSLSLSISLSLQ